MEWKNNPEIQIFQQYLRIPTVQPNVDYESCIEFLKNQAIGLNLDFNVFYPGGPKKPIAVLTWIGTQPNLPTIMLNSHMDVVPVFEDKWSHPPFAAEIDNDGKIFARGSQDMKCVGMAYLGAIRALKKEHVKLKRTIHVTFVPDEEIGGTLGMKAFVETPEFHNLNVGFSLDESVAAPINIYPVFYAERACWATGPSGHGSMLYENTAGEKICYVINKMLEFRAEQMKIFKGKSLLQLGDITSVNLTKLDGGVQINVVPFEFNAYFDIRLANDVDHIHFENMLRKWSDEAGEGVEVNILQKDPKAPETKLDDSNPYWIALKTCAEEIGMNIQPIVCPGGTDGRFLRKVGIPVIGLTPIKNVPLLLHDHNEFVPADLYLKAIEIYKAIIPKLANC